MGVKVACVLAAQRGSIIIDERKGNSIEEFLKKIEKKQRAGSVA
jgi:hypothetical protein